MNGSGLSRRTFVATGSMIVSTGLVGGCSGGMPLHRSSPSVETVSGRVVGVERNGVAVFKGIPYGGVTSGSNRFMPPQPPAPWPGILEAFDYGPTAPQRPAGSRPRPLYRPEPHQPERGEDCLRLNVWTPSTKSGRRPVMVWWHGGGFEAGSGSSVRYDGTNLCLRGDVVVVTVNHRLNVFGHCYLGEHLGQDFASSGNAGFLDLAASLRWVRENIDRFGGDPDRVMIFGQSGGGRKVSLAMAADATKGLFHRAAVQSGSHLRIQVPEQAAALTDRLLHELDVPARDARRLQDLPMETVLAAQLKVSAEAKLRFAPVADGAVFAGHPWDPSAPAVSADVPMIIGTARTELSNQLGHDESVYGMSEDELTSRLQHYLEAEDIPSVVNVFKASNPQADPTELFFLITSARGYVRDATLQIERRVAQGEAAAYRYCLMWRTPVEGGRRFSPHSLCVPLVFDNAAFGGIVGPPGLQAQAVADAMSEAWIAFAHTGDPNNDVTPPWQPYDLQDRYTMMFDERSALVADPHAPERLALADYPSQQLRRGRALHRTE